MYVNLEIRTKKIYIKIPDSWENGPLEWGPVY